MAHTDGLKKIPKTNHNHGSKAKALYNQALIDIKTLERQIERARLRYVKRRMLEEMDKRGVQHWSDAELEKLEQVMEKEADDMGLLVPQGDAANSGADREPPTTTGS